MLLRGKRLFYPFSRVQTVILDPPAGKPLATMIFFHGLGTNGHDFEPVARQLMPILPMRWVLPSANEIPVDLNAGQPIAAWYDLNDLTRADGVDWATVAVTRTFVRNLVAIEHERAPELPILLGGFSQGASISLHCGFDAPAAIKGIAALSGYVLAKSGESGLPANLDAAKVPAVFMGHGQWDDVVPLELAESSRDILLQAGVKVDWHTYPMPHSVCPQELQDLVFWLMTLLGIRLEEKE
jgi:phospholipase/carboxylesterase